MSNHRKRPANKLEIEDEPEVKNTLDKRINDQPPTKLQKVVQNDQISRKDSEDSNDQTIETQFDKKHVSEAHFVSGLDEVNTSTIFQCSYCAPSYISNLKG